jgi:hypothetical protein
MKVLVVLVVVKDDNKTIVVNVVKNVNICFILFIGVDFFLVPA